LAHHGDLREWSTPRQGAEAQEAQEQSAQRLLRDFMPAGGFGCRLFHA
jgi:hypothetical protein